MKYLVAFTLCTIYLSGTAQVPSDKLAAKEYAYKYLLGLCAEVKCDSFPADDLFLLPVYYGLVGPTSLHNDLTLDTGLTLVGVGPYMYWMYVKGTYIGELYDMAYTPGQVISPDTGRYNMNDSFDSYENGKAFSHEGELNEFTSAPRKALEYEDITVYSFGFTRGYWFLVDNTLYAFLRETNECLDKASYIKKYGLKDFYWAVDFYYSFVQTKLRK